MRFFLKKTKAEINTISICHFWAWTEDWEIPRKRGGSRTKKCWFWNSILMHLLYICVWGWGKSHTMPIFLFVSRWLEKKVFLICYLAAQRPLLRVQSHPIMDTAFWRVWPCLAKHRLQFESVYPSDLIATPESIETSLWSNFYALTAEFFWFSSQSFDMFSGADRVLEVILPPGGRLPNK